METFEEIGKLDSEIQDVFAENVSLICELLQTIEYPKTGNLILLFITRSNFIKEGIWDLYKAQNHYSMNILLRSMMEHYLRFIYLFIRFNTEKDDSAASEYIKFFALSEDVSIGKAWEEVRNFKSDRQKHDPFALFREINKNYQKYTPLVISEKSAQFKDKFLLKFIGKYINTNKSNKHNSLIKKIIPLFSELSSFVHGGPILENSFSRDGSEKELETELVRIVELSFSISTSVLILSLELFSIYNPELEKAFKEICSLSKYQTNAFCSPSS